MGAETIALITAISAATAATASVAAGVVNYVQSEKAARSQKTLQDEQRAQLTEENNQNMLAREKAASVAAVGGQSFDQFGYNSLIGGFGFGSSTKSSATGLGRGSLTGG